MQRRNQTEVAIAHGLGDSAFVLDLVLGPQVLQLIRGS
jgi:hypothetical protein